jgi:hypothetical protein
MFNILTGFTYRGLTPHKFTPMPGVHNLINRTWLQSSQPGYQGVICLLYSRQ